MAGAIINPREHNPARPTKRLLRRQQIILRRMQFKPPAPAAPAPEAPASVNESAPIENPLIPVPLPFPSPSPSNTSPPPPGNRSPGYGATGSFNY
jgi:membrane peptidoglycan carboxypeptidase